MGKEKLVNKPVSSRLGKETSAGDAVCGSKVVVPAWERSRTCEGGDVFLAAHVESWAGVEERRNSW